MTAIIKWLLGAGTGGFTRWIWIAAISAVIGIATLTITRALDNMQDSATDAGRNEQRAAQAEATIKQVEKANEASDNLRGNADAAHAECLRHARNPGDC